MQRSRSFASASLKLRPPKAAYASPTRGEVHRENDRDHFALPSLPKNLRTASTATLLFPLHVLWHSAAKKRAARAPEYRGGFSMDDRAPLSRRRLLHYLAAGKWGAVVHRKSSPVLW